MVAYRNILSIIALCGVLPALSLQGKTEDQLVYPVAFVGSLVITNLDIALYQKQRDTKTTASEVLKEMIQHKLLLYHAEKLPDIRALNPHLFRQFVAQELSKYDLAHAPPSVVKTFKKKLSQLVYERLQIDKFLQEKVYYRLPLVSPREVLTFFQQLPEEEKPIIPTQYSFIEITFLGPIEHGDMATMLASLPRLLAEQPMYSSQALYQKVTKWYAAQGVQVRFKQVTNASGQAYCAYTDLPNQLQTTLSSEIATWQVGQLSHPISTTIAQDQEGYVVYYLADIIVSHRANLVQDYQMLAHLAFQAKRLALLKAWFATHQHEVKIVDTTYQISCATWWY